MSRKAMKKVLVGVMGLVCGLILYTGGASPSSATPQASDTAVTFSNQVVRIFQRNCQVCHHPGDIAPFSLMTYEDAYPWAERIKEVTQSRYMPPWKPADGCGEFQNQRRLTEEEIATIARWVDAGAPEGDPADLPPPLEFPDGWTVGEPDLVVAPEVEYMPNPTGDEVYRCFSIPTNLTQDRYITKMEIRPGNRNIVHHVLLFIDATGQSAALDAADPGPGYTCFGGPGYQPADPFGFLIGGWAPGGTPRVLPGGVGILVPAYSRIVMQVHYHPTGEPEVDRTQVGFHFADGPIHKRLRTLPIRNRDFVIPAGAEHYQVTASLRLPPWANLHAWGIAPHMHLLGREMEVNAIYPDGTSRCLIYINDWDFNWQDGYQFTEPVPLPGGTQLVVTAYYDNSENNPRNPNSPPQPVSWGERTTDEMCLVFIMFTVDAENLSGSGP